MLRTKLAILAAGSAAALALGGFAAPASASDVGVQQVATGHGFTGNNGNGIAQPVAATVTCAATALPANSARTDSTSLDDIEWFSSLLNCVNDVSPDLVPATGAIFNLSSPKQFFRVAN